MPPVKLTRRKKKSRPRAVRARSKRQVSEQEIGFIGKALRGLGSLGGSTLGAMIGQPSAGASLGGSLGAAVSKWLGAGDYEVSRNSLVSKAAASIPMMHKTGQSVIVRHREFIAQISGSTAFTVQQTFNINPGLQGSFPWLSGIAARFQEYEIKGMVFHYIPTSGSYSSAGTALGSVMIQTTYRSSDDAPLNKVEMLNEYWSNEVVPCESMAHPIECDPKENPFQVHYVRTGALPSNGEPLLYDIGKTFVATSGMSTTNVVGDLWVTYEIELKKPLISSSVTENPAYYSAAFASPTTTAFFSGGASGVVGNLPLTFDTSRTITIPAGYGGIYVMNFMIYSGGGVTGTAATTFGFNTNPTLVNCSSYTVFGNLRSNIGTSNTAAGTLSGSLVYSIGVYKSDPSLVATVTLPAASWNSGTTDAMYVVVFSAPPS